MVFSFPLSQTDQDENPSFAKVWDHITRKLLDSDGSTKRENDERLEDWHAGRFEEVKPRQRARRVVEHDVHYVADGRAREHEESHEHDGSEDGDDEDREGKGRAQDARQSFEDALRAVRVSRVRMRILRDVLAQVPYLSPDGEEEAAEAPPDQVELGRSRIPVPSSTAGRRDNVLSEIANDVRVSSADHGDDCSSKDGDALTLLASADAAADPREAASSLRGLRDTILLVSSYIETSGARKRHFTREERTLLAPDIKLVEQNMGLIGGAMSRYLIKTETDLLRLSNTSLPTQSLPSSRTTTSTFSQRRIDEQQSPITLSDSIGAHQTYITSLTQQIPRALKTLTTTQITLSNLQRSLLSQTLQALEISRYGVLVRHRASKISFLASVAKAMESKTKVMLLEERIRFEGNEESMGRREVVRKMIGEIEREIKDAEERKTMLEGVMEEYETLTLDGVGAGHGQGAGLEVMRTLGKRYEEIESEMDGVKEDIARLEKQVQGTARVRDKHN